MMLNNEGFSAADLAAVVGNNNDGFGGNNGAWWLLILLLFANNGWGNGWGSGWGGNGAAASYMTGLATQQDIQGGFDQLAVMNGLNGITNAISNGFANSEISRTNMLSNLTNQMNVANMSQQQGWFNAQSAIKDIQFAVATEACADRSAVNSALRDVIASSTANTQALLNTINNGIQSIQDKLCNQEIDALKTQNANLQTQLNLANLRGSQDAQTAAIIANNEAQTANLIRSLNPTPIPAYITNGYPNSYGCNMGCGCNN